MAADIPTIYLDDPDPTWTATVRPRDTTETAWGSPVVAIDTGGYTVVATWDSTTPPVWSLRIPLAGLSAGGHELYLKVPNGADIKLGRITVKART